MIPYNTKTIVSVCMITYNHVQYIKQAIDGVLMQKFNFGIIELIISEDASTDETDTIIKGTIDTYKGSIIIKYTKHKNNLGMIANFLWTLRQAEGKYIALCEGDDYWTDDKKLQKQVEFMENNTEFSFCYHLGELLKERIIDYQIYSNPIKEPTTQDLINTHFVPSESLLFRNILKAKDYDLIRKAGSGDIPLVLQLSLYGNGYLIQEVMSVYRLHSEGVTGQVFGTFQRHLDNIKYYKLFNKITNKKFESELIRTCNDLYMNCIDYGKNISSFKQRFKFTIKLVNHLFKNFITSRQLVGVLKELN